MACQLLNRRFEAHGPNGAPTVDALENHKRAPHNRGDARIERPRWHERHKPQGNQAAANRSAHNPHRRAEPAAPPVDIALHELHELILPQDIPESKTVEINGGGGSRTRVP